MSRTRVYIKPFDESGSYASDFTEITRDVLKIGEIKQALDNTEYDVGVFRNSNFSIALRNDHGLYSEADNLKSIFKTKRVDTQVKVTWDRRNSDLRCGFFKPGEEVLGEEITLFEGLLTDVAGVSNIIEQDISFTVLGFESLLDRTEFPYSDVSNGDNISDILYAALNQTMITDLLTVDSSNISVGIDTAIDDKEDLENTTVKEAFDDLLILSNSVLYVKDRTIFIKPRTVNSTLEHTFYGPASINGIENIVDVKNYRDGVNRVRNYWTWKDASIKSTDADSVTKFGVQKKEIDSSLISVTSTTKISNILGSLKDEFSSAKTELEIIAPMKKKTLDLFLLDKVNVDYPTVYFPADENPLPRYGQNVYEGARYPFGQWSLKIDPVDRFKIMSVGLKPTEDLITFKLRKV